MKVKQKNENKTRTIEMGIGIVFLHHLSFLPLYEHKSSQLGNSRSLPRRKRGHVSPCLSLQFLANQYIDPLVVICWSLFYFMVPVPHYSLTFIS